MRLPYGAVTDANTHPTRSLSRLGVASNKNIESQGRARRSQCQQSSQIGDSVTKKSTPNFTASVIAPVEAGRQLQIGKDGWMRSSCWK